MKNHLIHILHQNSREIGFPNQKFPPKIRFTSEKSSGISDKLVTPKRS